MATQKQRSETTRRTLLKAFRASFLKRGFDKTTTQDVLAETGLSKGAMYHHFKSKTEIMEAIYEAESHGAINRALNSVGTEATPLDRLRAACLAWTQEVRTPTIARILFEIGPSALGTRRAKEIEDAYSLMHFEALLAQAQAAGDIGPSDPKLTAAMLNALVAEAALYTQRTGIESRDTLATTIDALFASLRT